MSKRETQVDPAAFDVADDGLFQIRKEQAEAFGRPEQSGFVVLKGSTAMREGSPNVKRNRPERDQLVARGVLVADTNPALFRFTADHLFSSQSQAAGVIIDGNSNGKIWQPVTKIFNSQPSNFSRAQIEEAMSAFEDYLRFGQGNEVFGQFGDPRDYWVRSSRARENRIFPTKPLVGFILESNKFSGGWAQSYGAAALLHNSGFIIVDQMGKPIRPPDDASHLIRDADRIRLCGLNYFIEPAREMRLPEVSIRASEIADLMDLRDAFPNICSALGSTKFQNLAQVSTPTFTEPNPSSSTTFTYKLAPQAETAFVSQSPDTTEMIPTNLILYGPPGTGKTYTTAEEAVRLCLSQNETTDWDQGSSRAALMNQYQRLVAQGRIEFVTFHQSMSYEEFVEGLRPSLGDDLGDGPEEQEVSSGFSLKPFDGVFKRVSERARLDSSNKYEEKRLNRACRVFKVALGRREVDDAKIIFGLENELIHIGWGGDIDWSDDRFDDVGAIATEWRTKVNPEATNHDGNIVVTYSFRSDMQIGDYVVVSDGRDSIRALGQVTGEYFYETGAKFHPHRRRVNWLWQDLKGVPRDRFYPNVFRRHSVYKLNQLLVDWDGLEKIAFGDQAMRPSHSARGYVLIIDEINRANVSKVFGELITLLEPDKRLGMPGEIRLTLPYSKKTFGVPANLHIIGTMNTADRSIALLDTALRRRFTFRELMPNAKLLSENVEGINVRNLLVTINDRIEYFFDREHQIGHAYFTRCSTLRTVEEVLRHRVIPLLAEYFYEDWAKVAAVLGDSALGPSRFLKAHRLSPPPGITEDDFSGVKLRWSLQESFDFSEFRA